jgi:hypothetical protein
MRFYAVMDVVVMMLLDVAFLPLVNAKVLPPLPFHTIFLAIHFFPSA